MQKISSRNLRSGPEEGKYLPFDPTLTKISAWLTSLPAFQISPLSLRVATRNPGEPPAFPTFALKTLESSRSSQTFRLFQSLLIGHSHWKPVNPYPCECLRIDQILLLLLQPPAVRNEIIRENWTALAQRTYIHGDSSNRMSSYTCVTMCCSGRSSLRIWVAVPSKTSITESPTRHRSIRAPPKKGREKTLVDPDVHAAFTRRANSVLVLVLRE